MNWNDAIARELGGVRQRFSDFVARCVLREPTAELDRCGGLDDALNDIGISRPYPERIIRFYPEAGWLLPAVTKRLGLDINRLDPSARNELGRTCATCRSHRRCRRWLATTNIASMEYRTFCPNVELFDSSLDNDQRS